ncbi:MAG: hypothetical protein AB9869_25975 [Verrucomicrobiia bacterium]
MHPTNTAPITPAPTAPAPPLVIQAEANRKRSESAKERPRSETGTFETLKPEQRYVAWMEATGGTECSATGDRHPDRDAKAAASKTNRGAVARGDKLAKKRPLNPAGIRNRLEANYPCMPPAELELATALLVRNPLADHVATTLARIVDGPQRWQDPGALAAQAFDDAGRRIQTVEPEVYAEPEPDLPDLTGDMLTVAIQAVTAESRGRRALQTNVAAVACLFGNLPPRDFAVRFGLSPTALGRALENVRKLLRVQMAAISQVKQ